MSSFSKWFISTH